MDSAVFQFVSTISATTILVGVGAFLLSLLGMVYALSGRCSADIIKPLAIGWSVVAAAIVVRLWLPLQQWVVSLLPNAVVPYYADIMLWVVVLALFGGVTWLGLNQRLWIEAIRRRKGRVGERMVSKVLAKAGYDGLHDQYVSDGLSIVQVDHLVSVGKLIVAIETKNYAGDVIGKGEADTWSQRFEDKTSITIPNPLRQSARHVEVLRRLSGPDVNGLVVFTSQTEFPAGMPAGVVGIDNLVGYLALLAEANPATDASRARWDSLKGTQLEQDREAARSRHDAMLSRTASHRISPVVIGMCRNCKGTDVRAAFGYNYYWKCRTCGTNTPMRVPDGFVVEEFEGNIVARGVDGTVVMVEERRPKAAAA